MTNLSDFDFGTHSYVGNLPCGCGCSIVRDSPAYVKDTAKDVAAMIKRGLNVTRMPSALTIHTRNGRRETRQRIRRNK